MDDMSQSIQGKMSNSLSDAILLESFPEVNTFHECARYEEEDVNTSLDESLPLAPSVSLNAKPEAGDEEEVDTSLDSLPLAPSATIGTFSSVPFNNELNEEEANTSLDSLPLAPRSIVPFVSFNGERGAGDDDSSLDSLPLVPGNCFSVNDSAHINSKEKMNNYSHGRQVKRATPLHSSTPLKKQRQEDTDEEMLPCTSSDDSGSVGVWSLSKVVNFNGCKEKCALKEHELTEYDILSYHCAFDSKTSSDQNDWLIQYFSTHCPLTKDGSKDVKNIVYIVNGKKVCFKLWLEIVSISLSRCYRLRRVFVEYGDTTNAVKQKRRRSLSPKTLEALTWMEHYFNKIGDKRPDKNAILLPTCLTEKRIHEILLDQLYHGDQSKGICLSQFNKLYRQEFKNVTIPKVCLFVDWCTQSNTCVIVSWDVVI